MAASRRDSVRLSVAVQHHPARPDCLERLLADLARESRDAPRVRIEWEVIEDPEPWGVPSPWRSARIAWASTPEWATHRLVLQDDAMPCAGFFHGAIAALRVKADQLVSFYMGHNPPHDVAMMLAKSSWSHWHLTTHRQWVPCVALAMPRGLAVELGAFDYGVVGEPAADDEAVIRWLQTRQHNGAGWVGAWQTIPSLVQHDDDAPSTMAGHRGGRMRYASCWIGEHDPRDFDWTLGADPALHV